MLISPYSLETVDNEKRLVVVQLTKKQIEDSPSLDIDKPVSCQYEGSYNGYYGFFIIDEETWAIHYLVVATKSWWPGKKVLISPQWIDNISWEEKEVAIRLSRETIKAAPEYTDCSLLSRDYETDLYEYYNREGYWVEQLSAV